MIRICLTLLLLVTATLGYAQKPNVKKAFRHADKQIQILIEETEKADKGSKKELIVPRTVEHGKLELVRSRDWTSGFFPGMLWYMNQYSGEAKWQQQARHYTSLLEKEQHTTTTHDLGFIIFCSFGNGYKLTGNNSYKPVIIQTAKSLSKRFNPTAGVIRSWDHNGDKWDYPVIIDNMMNLELLFEATRLSGDSSFHKIAVSHADKTLQNHFRPDFSTYHVVDYEVKDGSVRSKATHQGYSHESSWARGQAWALYGYTLSYRYTGNPIYLQHAENIARFILNHPSMPADGVPYWDYNDPQIPQAPRDASAAAITASALYELSTYSNQNKTFKKAANKILHSLTTKYASAPGSNKGFVLGHSTGNKPRNSEVDVPINYADYYYLEALVRSGKPKKFPYKMKL